MRNRLIAMGLACAVLAGCAGRAMHADAAPTNGFLCKVERAGPEGEASIDWSFDQDGTPIFWKAYWTHRVGAVEITAYWMQDPQSDDHALKADVDDATRMIVKLYPAPGMPSGTDGYVTIQFRREAKGDTRLTGWVTNYGDRAYSAGTSLGEVRAAADGSWLGLTAVDSRRGGRVVAQGILDPAIIERARPMIREMGATLEAMRADLRDRCAPIDLGPDNVILV